MLCFITRKTGQHQRVNVAACVMTAAVPTSESSLIGQDFSQSIKYLYLVTSGQQSSPAYIFLGNLGDNIHNDVTLHFPPQHVSSKWHTLYYPKYSYWERIGIKCKTLYSNVAPFNLERNPHCKRNIQHLRIICMKAEDINTRVYIFDSAD
jgi:hypothetical protein